MRKVLVITHYFPDRVGMGSVRLGGLVKYLPDFCWHPIVLTSKLASKPDGNFTLIETPAFTDVLTSWKKKLGFNEKRGFKEQIGSLDNIDSNISKITNHLVQLCQGILAYPDFSRNWYSVACDYANKAILEDRIDAVISSSSPVTAHLIANTVKKAHNIPWVADLRDLWTQNHNYPYGSLRKVIERRLELKTLQSAEALVTVSEPWADKLKRLHNHSHVYAITNGFDPDDYKILPLTKEFTITYTGQLYEGKQDPRLFLTVLRELISDGLIDGKKVSVRFFGRKAPWLEKFVSSKSLEDIVSFQLVERKVAVKKQAESQLLLLFHWDDAREKGVYLGKVFEYLGARRPIISIGGKNEVVQDLLNETNAGIFCGSEDSIKSALLFYYGKFTRDGSVSYGGNPEAIDKYSHKETARKYSQILSTFTKL